MNAPWPCRYALAWLSASLVASTCSQAWGQAPLDPTGRSGERPPFEREVPPPGPPPGTVLPPAPPPPSLDRETLPIERVFVRAIRVIGSTVFSAEELSRLTAPYVNRTLTSEDLEAIRVALTGLYVDRGYVNSGAILPDQTVTEGVITFEIIEGRLTEIDVSGNRWFRSGYLTRRIRLGAGPPLNINTLQERLQLVLEDARIRRLNAELRPGLRPGESLLNVRVEDRVPFRLSFDFNNYQSPAIGAERGIVTLEDENLTGNGDVLTLQYGRSEGLEPLLDFRYALPFTARDTTLILEYRQNNFTIIDEQFRDLDIESDTEIYGVTLRQPLYRTPSTVVAVELTGERLANETRLFGSEPFPLLPGADPETGETVVTALRIAPEFVHRTRDQVIAARSRFSIGLGALGATINSGDEIPDGRFFAWLGQFQWVRRLPVLDSQLVVRSDLQLADGPLLTLEQFVVGGRYSVRGYRENTLVRDNGFLASLELRVPVVRGARWADVVELAPFYDYGRVWMTVSPTPDPDDISSIGLGLRWVLTSPGRLPLRAQLELYWGHPLRHVTTSDGDLQDAGIHFRFVIAASQ